MDLMRMIKMIFIKLINVFVFLYEVRVQKFNYCIFIFINGCLIREIINKINFGD